MKIVVCFYFQENSIPLGKDIAEGFAALGHEVFAFDSSARERHLGVKRLAKSLAKLFGAKKRLSAYFERRQAEVLAGEFAEFCRQASPDCILVIRGERITPDVITHVAAETGARTIAWWVKNPRWQAVFRDEARRFDLAFTIDESSCDEVVQYLPCWAINRAAYYPLPFEEKKPRLLFVGAWSKRRQEYLEAVADLPLDVIGPDWLKALPSSSPLRERLLTDRVPQNVMATHYRSVWAVIDIRQIDQGWEQGVNMRFADVPASGTVLLTEPSREVERWQLDGRCARLFGSPGELRAAAAALLSDADCCRAMSRNAVEIAAQMPSFVDRAAAILKAGQAAAAEPPVTGVPR